MNLFNLDEDQPCNPNSVLEQCKNGLFCGLDGLCKLSEYHFIPACLREYHNRLMMSKNMSFYIPGKNNEVYFEIPYAQEQYLPTCQLNGNYERIKASQNKYDSNNVNYLIIILFNFF